MSTGRMGLARQGLEAIRALKHHEVSPEKLDRDALVNWPGWGPLAPAFDPEPVKSWRPITEELIELLTVEELSSARECIDSSFFTPPLVVNTVYELLEAAGFTGGRVLEPGCGSGNFLRGVPKRWDVQFTGVEKEIISAKIAQALHPEATILTGRYEKISPKGGFDAVVGNVPFSSQRIYDSAEGISANVHNYFIARSLRLLREGGYCVVVTSRYSLDSRENILRLTKNMADFVGAMRLPTGTFRSEGTDIVSDIVVFRKNTTATHQKGWYSNATHDPMLGEVNEYWTLNPSHVAGTMKSTGNYRNPLDVVTNNLEESVIAARRELVVKVHQTPMFDTIQPLVAPEPDSDGRKEGSFHIVNGTMMQVKEGILEPVKRGSAELHALVELRDLGLELINAESDPHASDESMVNIRQETLKKYQDYIEKYGALNRGVLHEGTTDSDTGLPSLSWKRPTLGGFRKDPDYATVMALESFDQDTGEAVPAPILLRRVNSAPVPVTSAESTSEALMICLGESGKVDLDRIADLLKLESSDAALEVLGDLVFYDPDAGQVVPARDYLSGDVRSKLVSARKDPRLARNVTALETVVPEDLGPSEIVMNLGNPCLTVCDIRDFLDDIIGTHGQVEHCPVTATWQVSGFAVPTVARTTWGTSRINTYELIHCALNGKAPVIFDEFYDPDTGYRKVRNPEQTIAAQEKLNAIQDRFNVWVWESPDRSQRLCATYNQRFNSYVPRVSDGSHLTFPGLSESVSPYPWQRNIVDQIVSTPAVLCGHTVGAGKTLSMALAVVTLKRFGLARKPLIVVPNHLLEQISREMKQAFPLGKFLIATKEDLAKDNRRLFAARCSTGDWDAVVMTHQGFSSLPVHPQTEIDWLEEQKAEYVAHLRSDTGGYAGAKEIARKVRGLESKLERLRDNAKTDSDQVLFEHLGVDYLAVDEAHYMKRLPVASRAEGFSMGASKRATDLLLKAETIAARKPGKPYLGLFTGTPWTNTLAETFVWQRFLQPEMLAQAGVDNFDAWAAVFVKRETVVEVTPDGSSFRTVTRPTKMMNLPELQTMLHQVSDVLTADDIALERPLRESENITVQQTPQQKTYVAGLVERAEKLRTTGGTSSDNMLVICGDGRRVALDQRLVNVPEDSPKINALAKKVASIYQETSTHRYGSSTVPGALQVVFCDQGTPNSTRGTQTYGRIRDALTREGIPAQRIRIIHEAKDDKARAALFAACREGKVSVLIGSTEKMGTGTNIQLRLAAVHHLDAPWRPADIEQREGRALRPGNLNSSVKILRYVTEGTFDAYMWQTLERKALGFAAMYNRNSGLRVVDDIGEVAPDYTQMKALATGNPLLLEQAEAAATVKKLRTLKAVDAQSVVTAKKQITSITREIERLHDVLEAFDELSLADKQPPEDYGNFTDLIQDLRKSHGRTYISCQTIQWQGLRITISGTTDEPTLYFRALGSTPIPKPQRLFYGSLEKAAAHLQKEAEKWERNIDHYISSCHSRLEALQVELPQAEKITKNYVFEREPELRAAETTLRDIEAQLASEAELSESA